MDLDSAGMVILPDSRPKHSKGEVYGEIAGLPAMTWVPVFCANCGVPYGKVPDHMDFVCWLCDSCVDKWGTQYGLALMPNERFWALAEAEMIEKYGRVLTADEVRAVTETSSPLTTLLREGIKR